MSDDLYIGPTALAPGAPKRGDRLARLLVWPLLIALFFLTILFYVLYSPLQVVGDSMVPSLHNEDRVLRTKSYGEPVRGDVVIINAGTDSNRDDIVKRVIAIPGDTVEIRDDVALVNGVAEDVSGRIVVAGAGEYRDPIRLKAGEVYVLGDNRPVSLDSRYIGPVPLERIRGRAVWVFLPLNDLGHVPD